MLGTLLFTVYSPLAIPNPPVPADVLAESTVDGQITKMKKWLTDFQHGDKTRDLYPYFTPVLSYVEGSWRKMDGDSDKIMGDDEAKVVFNF